MWTNNFTYTFYRYNLNSINVLNIELHSVITNDSPSSYIHKSAKNCAPLDDPCGIQESNRNRINNTLGQGYDYCECGDGVNRFYWMKVQTKLTVDSKNPNTNNTCKLRSKYLLVSSGQSILSIWESDCASSSWFFHPSYFLLVSSFWSLKRMMRYFKTFNLHIMINSCLEMERFPPRQQAGPVLVGGAGAALPPPGPHLGRVRNLQGIRGG